jgi:hypothetical protein
MYFSQELSCSLVLCPEVYNELLKANVKEIVFSLESNCGFNFLHVGGVNSLSQFLNCRADSIVKVFSEP